MLTTTALFVAISGLQALPFGSIYPEKRYPVVVGYQGQKTKYDVPGFARIKGATYSKEKGILRVTLRGELPETNTGYMSVEAYFDEVKGQKKQYMVAVPLGTAAYKPKGEGWLFQFATWQPFKKLTTTVNKSSIELSGLSSLPISKNLSMIVIRYLPHSFKLEDVARQTDDIVVEVWKHQRKDGGRDAYVSSPGPPLKRLGMSVKA